MGTDDLVRKGEEAIAAAEWETARAFLEKALEREESPEALTGLSKVATIQREYERSIELEERAFELFKRGGQVESASRSAYWLTFMYATYAGNFSAASGWKERAASVLEGAGDSAANGWILLLETPFTNDPAERERLATAALSTAHRFGDVDLEI